LVLLRKGDEVLLPAPYWVSYPDMIHMMEGNSVVLKTNISNNFKITPTQLEAAITKKTKLLILNSPSNPSGSAYSSGELAKIGEVLLRHPHVTILTDNIYEHIWWAKEPFYNLLTICPFLKERCLVISGVSKTYAMTGWRIGYTAGPIEIINMMTKAQSQSTANPCSISQAAATCAFNLDIKALQPMINTFKSRHDFFIPALNDLPGWRCNPTAGAFYAFVDVSECMKSLNITTDLDFTDYLLNKAGIASVPGSAFGIEKHVRCSYASNINNLRESVTRLKKLFDTG
jgi:aspartate aminotransferase